MKEKLRAGVAGLRRGLGFVRVLRAMDDVEVAGVADLDSERLEGICREYGIARGCSTLTELLEVGPDLVVLATPLPLHAAHAIEVLDAGVHVLSEVTAAVTREQAEALVAAAERSGRLYMMGENTCYWAFVQAAREMHAHGDFGTVFYSEAEYIHDVQRLMRDDQGRLTWRGQRTDPIIYCTHSLGPLLWIMGQYPTEVVCLGTGSHFVPGLTDLQTALIRLTDGGLARVTVSFTNVHGGGGHRYTLYGTRASLDTGWTGRDQPRFWTRDIPHLQGPLSLPLGFDVPGAPAAARLGGHGTAEWYMVRAFLDSVRTGTRPPIDVYDGAMWSLAGICAIESAATGGRPVAIPQYQQRRVPQ